ncbi:SAM-dependent methyltransferase [Allocatelliglobosispora scoriae]|uniref:SAM-dependent methyltransferase n=1 Tax=Allocatelliglobosispora scoriae TaxID=643052 RepID=A0A841BKD4_9ACTN|nr:methyltransferase domain-containing protein [Allocatelliglobosispora scoriae]MBB5868734.1 SAM-dependent methyltransferase [Allocatelliglobosispora scoriae]
MRSKPVPTDRYSGSPLSHAHPSEATRLRSLELMLDPLTVTALEGLRPRPDWRCLEIGGGGGSIARWLANRCPAGSVLATDVDVTLLDTGGAPNITTQVLDLLTDPLPEAAFDLIHGRAVLVHLGDRDAIIARLARALVPGGWLVVDDPCVFGLENCPYPAMRRLVQAFDDCTAQVMGSDIRSPRRLPLAFAAAGLVELGLIHTPLLVGGGGSTMEVALVSTLERIRPMMLAHGTITEREYAEGMALFADPSFLDTSFAHLAVWGRAPSR